jgi:hypothetical protein
VLIVAANSKFFVLFALAPRQQEYARSHQCSETNKKEASPLDSLKTSWNVGHGSYSFFPPERS